MNEERDELWELLGRAKKPEVSSFFAANVLRELRQGTSSVSFLEWLRRQWRAVGAAATAILVVGATVAHWQLENRHAEQDRLLAAQELAGDPDYDAIAQLDELLAFHESSLWIESSVE